MNRELTVASEGQSVSARWRAITRSQTKVSPDDPYVLNFLAEEIANVLALTGWSRRRLNEQNLLDKFQIRLAIIVNMVLRLRTAVGEDVTSGDLKTYTVLSNTEFDRRIMDDGFPQDRGGPVTATGCVAGTTDIGLQRSVKGSSPLILSKPKVVLCSTLLD
jgi:hypothetical protein